MSQNTLPLFRRDKHIIIKSEEKNQPSIERKIDFSTTTTSDNNNSTTAPKYILSLDGGGVRGIYTMNILDQISTYLKIPIREKFDLIVGTSIGGIIGSALAVEKLNLPLDEMFSQKNIETIFDKSIWDKILKYAQFCPIYDGKGKTKILKNYLGDIKLGDIQTNLILTSWNLTQNMPVLFSTINEHYKDIKLVDACDATSAAPIYFPPVNINGEYYIDGGVACNNPIMTAYSEAKRLFPNTPLRILSIGTGIEPHDSDWKSSKVVDWGTPQWLSNGLLELIMDSPTEMILYQMNELFTSRELANSQLLRLDIAIPNIVLDDTNTSHLEYLKKAALDTFEKNADAIKIFFQ